MTEDFETSLQVLRGFDTDISIEVNEIKVLNLTATVLFITIETYRQLSIIASLSRFKHSLSSLEPYLHLHCFSGLSFMNVLCTEICGIIKQKSHHSIC